MCKKKKNMKIDSFKQKKNKSTETVSEKDLIADLLYKFKVEIL